MQPFFFVARKGLPESSSPLCTLFVLAGALPSRLNCRCRSLGGVVQVLDVLRKKERVLESDPGALSKDGVELSEPKKKEEEEKYK